MLQNEWGNPPITLDEAWKQCRRIFTGADENELAIYKAIFVTGMGVAMSMVYHHGFADLRAEIEREQKGM